MDTAIRCRPGAASTEQGVVQTASGRLSSIAFAPPGLLMMMIGWTGFAAVEAALWQVDSPAACLASDAAGGASALGLASSGAVSAVRGRVCGDSSFAGGGTGS